MTKDFEIFEDIVGTIQEGWNIDDGRGYNRFSIVRCRQAGLRYSVFSTFGFGRMDGLALGKDIFMLSDNEELFDMIINCIYSLAFDYVYNNIDIVRGSIYNNNKCNKPRDGIPAVYISPDCSAFMNGVKLEFESYSSEMYWAIALGEPDIKLYETNSRSNFDGLMIERFSL